MEKLRTQRQEGSRRTIFSGFREVASQGATRARNEARAARAVFDTSVALGTIFIAAGLQSKHKDADISDFKLTAADLAAAKRDAERVNKEIAEARAAREEAIRLDVERTNSIAAARAAEQQQEQ